MADDLTGKLTAVVWDHFQGASADDIQVDLMIALASLAAALIAEEPFNFRHRRAVFDDLVTKGLDRLVSERLDKMGH